MPYYFYEYRGGSYYSFHESEYRGLWGGYIKKQSAVRQHNSLQRNGHKVGSVFWQKQNRF